MLINWFIKTSKRKIFWLHKQLDAAKLLALMRKSWLRNKMKELITSKQDNKTSKDKDASTKLPDASKKKEMATVEEFTVKS